MNGETRRDVHGYGNEYSTLNDTSEWYSNIIYTPHTIPFIDILLIYMKIWEKLWKWKKTKSAEKRIMWKNYNEIWLGAENTAVVNELWRLTKLSTLFSNAYHSSWRAFHKKFKWNSREWFGIHSFLWYKANESGIFLHKLAANPCDLPAKYCKFVEKSCKILQISCKMYTQR